MTSKYSTSGDGLAYTHVKPTAAERELKARKQQRIRAAVDKPQQQAQAAAWPPGFVSAIKVNKHGQMI